MHVCAGLGLSSFSSSYESSSSAVNVTSFGYFVFRSFLGRVCVSGTQDFRVQFRFPSLDDPTIGFIECCFKQNYYFLVWSFYIPSFSFSDRLFIPAPLRATPSVFIHATRVEEPSSFSASSCRLTCSSRYPHWPVPTP